MISSNVAVKPHRAGVVWNKTVNIMNYLAKKFSNLLVRPDRSKYKCLIINCEMFGSMLELGS